MTITPAQLSLPIMETFYSIQGEGFYQGQAAYFIRLGGCNVGCTWCDVKESWDASLHSKKNMVDIIAELETVIKQNAATQKPIVVVTGGEPMLHNLDTLTKTLNSKGFRTNVETSGSAPLSGNWNWICVSPKKFKPPLIELLSAANELKIIVYHTSDFEWAAAHAKKVSSNCKLFLQPEWSKRKTITPMIFDYVKAHPQWELSLQIHKYIAVP